MNSAPLSTLIIGAGIGGLAAAVALARHGHAVHVVEKGGLNELGAGIQLGANATRVLAELGVLDRVAQRAVRPDRIVLCDAGTGAQLTALTLGDEYCLHFGYPYLVVHRGELLDALVQACREHSLITMETDRTVDTVVPGDDCVDVHFADGGRYACRVLIGADGLRSTVRPAICADRPVPTGFVTYRAAVAPPCAVAREVRVWIGPDIHVVAYPIRAGALHNLAAVFRPGDGDRGPYALRAAFTQACREVRRVVELLAPDRCWDVYDLPELSRWGHGRVTLLGDAAHVMVQYLAQGACQALEDAMALGRAVAGYDATPEALRAYENARIDRTARCARVARVWGQLWHSGDPLVCGLRDRVFTLRADSDYRDVEWLHGYTGSTARESSRHPVIAS